MGIDKLSEIYLFEKHSKSVIKKWNKNLKYGFFKRAWGGYANDGDEFGIWLKYANKTQLLKILDALQIELKKIPENHPKAKTEKKYNITEFEQPSHIKIDSTPCHCWIENGQIKLTFSGQKDGNKYEVSEMDFENCLVIEKIISKKSLEKYVSYEYQNYITNISRKVYPELFD